MINKAIEAYINNNFEEALHLYLDVYQQEPDNTEALEGLARSYYRLKRFDDAIIYCNKALSKDISLAWPYLVLSYISFLQKKILESKQDAKVAIERDSSGWETNFWWGSLLCYENKTDEGLAFLEKAVAIKKDDWYLYNNLSLAYLNKGNMENYYDMRRQMNKLKPSLSNVVAIHLERWAKLFTFLVIFVHFCMVFIAFIAKQQIILIVPFIIDVLWLIGGVWYVFHRQFKLGLRIIILGILYSIFPVLAYLALHK